MIFVGLRVIVSIVVLRLDVFVIIDMYVFVNFGVVLIMVIFGIERFCGVIVVVGFDYWSVVKVGWGCKDSEFYGEDGSKEGNRDYFGGNERFG